MFLTWREQLDIFPHLKEINEWPDIDQNTLSLNDRTKFLRNKKIIAKVLKGFNYNEISNDCNVSKSTISYLINRCLSSSNEDDPVLMRGLIPNLKLNTGKRKTPLSELHIERGSRGSFIYLLDNVSGLKNKLDKMIKAYVTKKAYGQNLTPKIFHEAFLKILNDLNYPKNKYPYDKLNKGYTACRAYLQNQIVIHRISKPKKKRVIITKTLTSLAFQEIQIDSQTMDLTTKINLVLNDELEPIKLSRLTLFIATDVATDCRIGYYLSINKAPNQYDLLSLFKNIFSNWKPMKLKTPGLIYIPGSGFPSGLSEEFRNIGLNMVRLDNAFCHIAHTVRDYVCNELGATISLGLPAKPKMRNLIEFAFRILNYDMHRFPSTTGSHPKDPIKETSKNSKKPPIITLNALEEVLSVIISGHNAKPQNKLGGSSPLGLMKFHMANFPIRINYKTVGKENNPSIIYKQVKVRCIIKENRSPHINYMKCRYTGDCLINAKLVNKDVILKIDSDDIRKLEVLTLKGESLGFILAPRSWQNFMHSVVTRRKIFELTKEWKLNNIDPIAGYFEYLLENKHLPIIATELVRVYREINDSNVVSIYKNKTPDEPMVLDDSQITDTKSATIEMWSPDLVRRNRNV